MLKFFACYIWLGFGFLLTFKILFANERTFNGFPIPLITMLVMMLGDVSIDMIFPKETHISLKKDSVFDKDDHKSTYVGDSDDEQDFLQFAGDTNIHVSDL